MNKNFVILSILIVIILITGCNSIELQSTKKDTTIIIDGNDDDWEGKKLYLREKNITIGIMNDDKYLYLCFYPTTRKLGEQLLKQGFTLWFNGEGKSSKDLGIRFPLSTKDFAKNRNHNKDATLTNRATEPEFIERMVNKIPRKLEILKAGNKVIKLLDFDDLVGMELALGAQKGVFVYELKIPYISNEVYSAYIGAEPESEITVYFESEEIDPEEMRSAMHDRSGGMEDMGSGGGKGSGGGRGGGGGKSGGGGGGRGGEERKMPSMNFWAKVSLATETPKE